MVAADHEIEDESAFQSTVVNAKELAEQGKLVTFGIVGDKPETGYGYIKRGAQIDNSAAYVVNSFVEKPNLETAKDYMASGEYYWNSGMFMFKASRYLQELKEHRPDIYSACEQAMAIQNSDMDFIHIDKAAFEACPDDSIDYAVMEKTKDAVVIPLNAGLNDVGGFSALWDVSNKDKNGNVLFGDVKAVDTKNTLVFGDKKLIATVCVED